MTAAGTTDEQLLESYSRGGDQEALLELVRRYIDLVYSAALRQVRDARLARDVTRAVFYILTQKKRSLPKSEPLACWMYRATRCAAVHALESPGGEEPLVQLLAADAQRVLQVLARTRAEPIDRN